MTANETKLFLTVKIMGMHQIRFLLDALQKMTTSYKDEIEIKDKEIDTLKQIIDLKVLNEKVNGKTKL